MSQAGLVTSEKQNEATTRFGSIGRVRRDDNMHTQIEQHGDRFFARLRNNESVFMWADFFSEADARKWANAHFDEAVKMQKESDETWPGGAKNAHLGRRASLA